MAIEIVDLPIKLKSLKIWWLSIAMLVCQRVMDIMPILGCLCKNPQMPTSSQHISTTCPACPWKTLSRIRHDSPGDSRGVKVFIWISHAPKGWMVWHLQSTKDIGKSLRKSGWWWNGEDALRRREHMIRSDKQKHLQVFTVFRGHREIDISTLRTLW